MTFGWKNIQKQTTFSVFSGDARVHYVCRPRTDNHSAATTTSRVPIQFSIGEEFLLLRFEKKSEHHLEEKGSGDET